MRVWTSNEFGGHWPVGTAAVVVAETVESACEILMEKLGAIGLGQTVRPDQLQEITTETAHAVVLCDGDY